MQVKDKLFPYPIINHNKVYSNFPDSDFKIEYDRQEDDDSFVLKNCRFETESVLINKLFDEKKIDIVIIIECSYTVYRKFFPINNKGVDIRLSKDDFTEKVEISMFAYVKENFILPSNELDEDYRDISIELEKYDIIGVNDGFNFTVAREETKDNMVQSIFSIVKGENVEDEVYNVDCDTSSKILITISNKEYEAYNIIYTAPIYKEVFFNMFLIPALIQGLTLCKDILKDESKDLDDVGYHYKWFRSIQKAYLKLEGKELSLECFREISPVSFAQTLLGKPLGKALQQLVNETTKIGGDSEDE